MDNSLPRRPTPPPGFSYGDAAGTAPAIQAPPVSTAAPADAARETTAAAAPPAITRPAPPPGFSYAPATAAITRPTAEPGDFMRGFKTSAHQLPQLAGGSVAFLGDVASRAGKALGGDGAVGNAVTNYGLGVYQKHEADTKQLSKDSDSFTHMIQHPRELGSWLKYNAGYMGGQMLEGAAMMGAGALAGSEVPVAGNAAGAVAGLVAKPMVEKMILKKVGELMAEKGLSREATELAAKQAVKKRLGAEAGAATAGMALNESQELGSIYGEAKADAAKEGRELTGGDLARIGAASVAAAGVDTLGDRLLLGDALKGVKPTEAIDGAWNIAKDRLKATGKAMGKDALKGAATEAAQTEIERYGAGQSLADAEAFTDVLDSSMAGAVGGGMAGMGAGLHTQKPAPAPAPGPLGRVADAAGAQVVATPVAQGNADAANVAEVDAESLLARAQRRMDVLNRKAGGSEPVAQVDAEGNTVVVPGQPAQPLTEAEQDEHAFLTQNGADPQALADRLGVRLAPPAVVADAGSAESNAVAPAPAAAPTPVAAAAVAQSPAAPVGPADHVIAAGAPLPVAPWGDTTTGESRAPAADELTRALTDRLAWQYNNEGHMRVPAKALAAEWGVPEAEINKAGKAAMPQVVARVQAEQAALAQAAPAPERAGDRAAAAPAAPAAAPAAATPAAQNAPGSAPAASRAAPTITRPTAPADGAASTTASVPFMVTQATKKGLRDLGHTDADIATMTPAQANATLKAGQPVHADAFPDDVARLADIGSAPVASANAAAPATSQATAAPQPQGAAAATVEPAPAAAPMDAARAATVRTAFDAHPAEGLGMLAPAELRAVARAAGKKFSDKAAPANIVANLTRGEPRDVQAALRPALEQVLGGQAPAEPVKWFGSRAKAEAHVAKQGLAATHAVVDAGKSRFEIRPQAVDADGAATAPALADKVESAAAAAATHPGNDKPEPTQAQKEAGNYAKGHVSLQGLDISIENPRGSTRSGTGPEGPWSHEMSDHYGYIKRTEGADGDHVDVYVGPNPESAQVFVVDQTDQQSGAFDEHKVMLGFDSEAAAVKAYRSNFDKGWKVGPVRAMDMAEFKAWLKEGDTTQPAANATTASEAKPRTDVPPPSSAMSEADFAAHLPTYVAQYREKAAREAGNPDYYNADLAKELFPEYSASKEARRDHNEKVGKRASKIAFAAFEQRLKEPAEAGKVVTLMAGGTGSGKSALKPDHGIVYDSTMYDTAAAKRNIELVLASGRGVEYGYVFTQPTSAFQASITRGKKGGRYVNLTAFVRTHEGAYKAAQALMRDYAGDNRVQFYLYDNTDFAGRQIEALPAHEYNGLRERLQAALDVEYQAGRISADEYRAVARAEPPARGDVGVAGRGQEAHPDRGSQQGQGLVEAGETPPKGEVSATEPAADSAADPDARFKDNKVFTADKVAAARARLKGKLGTLNAGIDPEVLLDGLTIAGAYIESGARSFGAYAKAMVDDLGDGVKPFLRSFYESVRHYPGFDSAGMSTPAEAERLHAQMLTGMDAHPAVGDQPAPAKRKPAAERKAKAPADRTLTQDWGVERIDGHTALPGQPYTRTDFGLKGGVKDAFLKEAKGYLQAVSEALIRAGYREHEGKARPVSVNEGGPAGSGDVTLVLRKPGGDGVYVHVAESSLRGVVPGSRQGVSVMFRATDAGDKYGAKSRNQWAPADLTAGELASLIGDTLGNPDIQPATAPAATRAEVSTDEQRPRTAHPEPAQPGLDRVDPARGARAARGRGRDSEPGSAQADLAGVEAGEPAHAGPSDGGERELPGRPGDRAAREDVADGAGPAGQRDAVHGRAGAGRARNTDDGARGHGGDGAHRTLDARPVAATDPEVVKPPAEVSPANPGAGNYHMDDPLAVVGGGSVARFNKNKAAIELYNQLRDEGRKPTAEEQAVLAGYTGWGSFGQELFQGDWARPAEKDGWQERGAWLREAVGQQAWESLQRSITNAHYTDPPTVMAMWDMVRRLGFEGGRVLEPSMGIGNFFAMMPRELATRSKLSGIELDEVTGGMAQLLYPDANVQVKGYQDSRTPDNFHDIVIGNWPFENTTVADRRYNRLSPMLHDYFYLKALDQTRPGGLVVGITSAGTMDKKSDSIRTELARKGELVAAFRLPSGAFKDYAGTSVVTDILILRKRAEPIGNPTEANWIASKDYVTPQGETVSINEYYHAHPENVLGTIEYAHGTTSNRPGMTVTRPADLPARLARAVASLPVDGYHANTRAETISYVTNHTADREGALTATKDGLFVVRGEQLAPAEQVATYALKDKAKAVVRVEQLHRLIELRKLYAALIEAERSAADPAAARAALKQGYDGFVKDHGLLNQSFGLGYLRAIDDPFYPALAALEVATDGKGKTASYRPAQILSESTTRARPTLKNPGIADAYVIARNSAVNPSLAQIAALAGKTEGQVKAELIGKGTVFELPGGDIVPADMYLSGNVREKLRQARAAVEVEGNEALQRNVDALEKVIPADIPYYKIETQFGATWVATDYYRQYIAHMLGMDAPNGIDVGFRGGRWRVQLDEALKRRPEYRAKFGTEHTGFRALVQAAISNQSITIRGKDTHGNPVVDTEATREVSEKIANIRSAFADWLWSDPERKVVAEREYNEVRNAYATPSFDGSFLGFEGMALSLGRGKFDLRQHQVNAIWRALVTRKSLNAHEVGTGKTFTMGGIAVESRRYGIARKPLILAHNANSKSVAHEIQQMYPAAKVLYIDNLSPATVDVKLRQIANDDWDAVVMPHSLIDRLSMREETLMGMAREEISKLLEAAHQAADDDGVTITNEMLDDEEELKKLRSPTAKELVKMRNRIIATIQKQSQRASREGAVAFEDLGIDMVMVDEAHEFKKPPVATAMKMKGLQTQSSDKSIALNFMTKYVRSQNNGGNVHLFTGTPVTNTMTEVFHMMRYIMQEEMQEAGVDQFDGWFGSFAREVNDVELNAAAEYEAVTRLAAFINVPELRRMIGQYMDVVFSDDMPEMQPRRTASGKTMADALSQGEQAELLNGRTEGAQDRPYKKVVVETADLTPAQASAFGYIQSLAKSWRNFSKKQRKEAMLRGDPESPIITEGLANKASLDARLLRGRALAGMEGQAKDEPGSKASRVVANVLDIYQSHPLANQVIFSDLGMGTTATRSVGEPGEKTKQRYKVFSTLRDVIERLVAGGIPREQIALVDGSTSKDKRKDIADKMNTGELRVVIGSSDSLGVGVNMQHNLRAMHHLDAPWMPGDLEQRNGRGQRQGNQWNTVLEYRYLTDRLDGRRWQVLAVKDRFIKSFLKANDTDRVIEGDAANDEQSDILQTFAEAAGDPRILIREKLKKKIEALQAKERMHGRAMADNQSAIRSLGNQIETSRKTLATIERDGAAAKAADVVADNAGTRFRMTIDGTTFDNRKDADAAAKAWIAGNVVAGSRRITLGAYGGHKLFARWGSFDPTPTLSMEFGDTEITGPAGSVASLEAGLRNFGSKVDALRAELAGIEQSRERMQQSVGEPFHLAGQLGAQQKALTELEKDITLNPVPPPAWLRQGAPIDTETHWDGKPYVVTGHRWTDQGWFVMGERDGKAAEIPYTEAKDGQGIAQYEAREFQSPKVLTEAERKAADAAAPTSAPAAPMFSLDGAAAPDGVAHLRMVNAVKNEATQAWGANQPRVRVVHSADLLPDEVKAHPRYRSALGVYHKGDTVYLVAPNLRTRADVLRTLAHEAVGHYGVDRIVDEVMGAGAWGKITAKLEALRADPSKAHARMQSLLAEVERRYRAENGAKADPLTFAREFMAVSAEKGIQNSLLDRVLAAVRQWLRKVMPSLKVSDAELRQLLVRSDAYLRSGEADAATALQPAAVAFSSSRHDPNQRVKITTIPGGRFGDVGSPEARRIAKVGARQYLDALRLRVPAILNKDTGWKIAFTSGGNRELLRWADNPARVEALAAAPSLLHHALLADSKPWAHGRPGDMAHYFYAPVRIGDALHVARLVVREDANGNRVYDMNASAILDAKNPVAVDGAGKPAPIAGAGAPIDTGHEITVAQLRDAVNAVEKPGWEWSQARDGGGAVAFAKHGDPFYSAMNESVQRAQGMPRKAEAAAWSQWLDGAQRRGEFKAAERDWLGVDAWLAKQPGPVTGDDMGEETFTAHAIDITPKMRETAQAGLPMFSRPDDDPDQPRKKRDFSNAAKSVEALGRELQELDRSVFQKGKDWLAGKARDFEPAALGALQLRHVLELAADDATLAKPAKLYADLYQRMDGDRNSMTQEGAAKVDALNQWARQPGAAGWLGKVRPEAQALFKFMHAVTQLAVDPTNAYEKLLMRDSRGEHMPWTKELVKERIKALQGQMRGRHGDDKTPMIEEIKSLRALPAREKAREARYPELVREWNKLTPEAQRQFQIMREHYREQSAALEAATIEHLQALDIPRQNKLAAIDMVQRNFADAKVDGVYFPLGRFGDYWISAQMPDGEYAFTKYETAAAQQLAEKRLIASGATIEARGRQDNNYRAKDAPSGTFMGDLMGVLRAGNAPEKIQDQIYQMYLQALPNLSLRKHGIHRGNVAGYTDDVPRVFASSVFHGAHQISKARYSWQLQDTLEHMRGTVDARRTVMDAGQASHADALMGELNRRHDWILNPTDSKLANVATSIGFTWFLGASPASALVNLIQIPQIVLPVLGAHHGFAAAAKAIGRATKEAVRTGGNIEKALAGEDLDAFKALQRNGTFQRTATHALAGVAEGDALRSAPAYTRVMKAISWMFHKSEVINREATGMAAFRLARAQGKGFDAAVKYADEMTNGTHGDYSNANRSRYMQGNTAKILLQFKNYAVAMSWLWGRNFYQAFKGESPETRALARRTLTGLTGMTALFAGVVGLPMFNLLRYAMEAAHWGTGDDDEPWDFLTEFRSWLAEHLGETAASLIADGVANKLGASVSSRVSMSDLWFREADKQLEGADAYHSMLESIAGPLGGMLKNLYVGNQQISRGYVERGIETMMPTAAKNVMKALRFAHEGVNTLRGDPIVPDVSAPQALIQALGFQPTKIAEQQRINNALMNYQKAIQDRRQALMNAFAIAQQAGDVDGRGRVTEKIQAFNGKYPEIAIRMSNLQASLRTRAQRSAQSDNGIMLNKKLAGRVREEVGAMAGE